MRMKDADSLHIVSNLTSSAYILHLLCLALLSSRPSDRICEIFSRGIKTQVLKDLSFTNIYSAFRAVIVSLEVC